MTKRFHATAAALLGAVLLVNCSFVDDALTSRTESVNVNYNQFLNNEILSNIVLASHAEPLNFVYVAKYTAAETLSLTSNLFTAIYAPHATHPMKTFGPNNALAQAQNSFDINSLENKEFYTGLLKNVNASGLELWFRQGLPHELVFYTLLESIRVTTSDGAVYEYRNDPSDDRWTDENTRGYQNPSPYCVELAKPVTPHGPTRYDPPFGPNKFWTGIRSRDCYFHKFDYFVRLAWKYGLREETITVKNPKWTEKSTSEPKMISKSQLCYDPALAREHGAGELPGSICGFGKQNTNPQEFVFSGGSTLKSIELTFRSPFAIFRYLGQLVATRLADRVQLVPQDIETSGGDTKLLTVLTDSKEPCFAEVSYQGVDYCVPAHGAPNTKRIFTLLRALLAFNTSALDLNPTPTVRVTP